MQRRGSASASGVSDVHAPPAADSGVFRTLRDIAAHAMALAVTPAAPKLQHPAPTTNHVTGNSQEDHRTSPLPRGDAPQRPQAGLLDLVAVDHGDGAGDAPQSDIRSLAMSVVAAHAQHGASLRDDDGAVGPSRTLAVSVATALLSSVRLHLADGQRPKSTSLQSDDGLPSARSRKPSSTNGRFSPQAPDSVGPTRRHPRSFVFPPGASLTGDPREPGPTWWQSLGPTSDAAEAEVAATGQLGFTVSPTIAAQRQWAAKRRQSLFSLGAPTPTNQCKSVVPEHTRVTETAAISPPDPVDGSYGINGYVVLDTIGHGAHGEVFVAFDSATGETRAIKSIRRPASCPESCMAEDGKELPMSTRAGSLPFALARDRQRRQRLAREVAIMKRCRHPNIVRLYEVIDDPAHDRMYLVMQHVEHGSIVTLRPDGTVEKNPKFASPSSEDDGPVSPSNSSNDRSRVATIFGGPISPIDLAHFADQIVSGLQYLHRRGILHRDLKPDNILLGAHDTVYLSDFGVSELFDTAANDGGGGDDDGKLKPNRKSPYGVHELMTPTAAAAELADMHNPNAPHAGTMAFMAPELLMDTSTSGSVPPTPVALTAADRAARRRAATPAVDVWALGVSLFALLYGRLPWDEIVNRSRGRNSLAVIDEIANNDVKIPSPRPIPVPPPTAPPHGASPPRRVHTANDAVAGRPPIMPVDAADDAVDDANTKALHAAVDALVGAWTTFLRKVLVRDAAQRPTIDVVAGMLQDVKAAAEAAAAAKDIHDASSEALSDSQQRPQASALDGDDEALVIGRERDGVDDPPSNASLFPPSGPLDFASGAISPRVISKASIAPVSPNVNAALQAAGSPVRRQPPAAQHR